MEKMVEELKKKGHLLHTWGGDSAVESSIQEWEKIRVVMQSKQQMFAHQVFVIYTVRMIEIILFKYMVVLILIRG